MKKNVSMVRKAKTARGAAMVEYGLLLFAVIIAAAGAIRKIGPKLRESGEKSTEALSSD
jgi:Flp pilus assembly pilin Flp